MFVYPLKQSLDDQLLKSMITKGHDQLPVCTLFMSNLNISAGKNEMFLINWAEMVHKMPK